MTINSQTAVANFPFPSTMYNKDKNQDFNVTKNVGNKNIEQINDLIKVTENQTRNLQYYF